MQLLNLFINDLSEFDFSVEESEQGYGVEESVASSVDEMALGEVEEVGETIGSHKVRSSEGDVFQDCLSELTVAFKIQYLCEEKLHWLFPRIPQSFHAVIIFI